MPVCGQVASLRSQFTAHGLQDDGVVGVLIQSVENQRGEEISQRQWVRDMPGIGSVIQEAMQIVDRRGNLHFKAQ